MRYRIRRFINGLGRQEFYDAVPSEWLVANYIRFLNILEFCWRRLAGTQGILFDKAEYGQLCFDLLSAFWGNDIEDGYWSSLKEDQRYEAATMLLDYQADALTLAVAVRLLTEYGIKQPLAPVVVARLYQSGTAVGIFTQETMERALVYLDQPERDPVSLLVKIRETQKSFFPDRYCKLLVAKYQLRSTRLQSESGGFEHGPALIVEACENIQTHPYVLSVLADWIQTCEIQESERHIFQMYWNGKNDLLVYDVDSAKLSYVDKQIDKKQIFENMKVSDLSKEMNLHFLYRWLSLL